MKPGKIVIRTAKSDDAPRLLEIYAPYVEKTSITFEYAVPTVDEFRSRIVKTLEKYPYLVAETNGEIAGYAYAGALKERAAYDWAVELSVYVDARFHRQNIGAVLYERLEEILKKQNVTNIYACITYSDVEDEVHNNGSLRFHENRGFTLNAHFHNCGYKFSRWWDMVWMEKFIAPHNAKTEVFIPFPNL